VRSAGCIVDTRCSRGAYADPIGEERAQTVGPLDSRLHHRNGLHLWVGEYQRGVLYICQIIYVDL